MIPPEANQTVTKHPLASPPGFPSPHLSLSFSVQLPGHVEFPFCIHIKGSRGLALQVIMDIPPTPVYLGKGHRMRAAKDKRQEQPVSALIAQLFPGGETGPRLLCDPRQVAVQGGSFCLGHLWLWQLHGDLALVQAWTLPKVPE